MQDQIYRDSGPFTQNMQKLIDKQPMLIEVPKAQRRAEKRALADLAKTYNKQEAAARSYLPGHHTMATIADYFQDLTSAHE